MIKNFSSKLLYLYSLLLILSLFFLGIKSLFFGSLNEKILWFFLIFPAGYFLIEIGRKLPKIKVFLFKKFFSGFLIFSKFISIPLLAIVFSFCFFRSANFKEFLFSFSFLPVIFFFVKKPKATKSVVFEPIAEEEAVKDPQLRQFLRVVGVTGVGLFLLSLLNPKKVGAAFFGSVPGPGTVALKDTSDTKINPATSDNQTNGSQITNLKGMTSPTSTAVTLTTADTAYKLPSSELANRKTIIIYNSSDTNVYIGSSGITTSTGVLLPPEGQMSLDCEKDLYAVCGTSGKIVNVLELS